jgi:hypothetical protein
MTPEEIENLHKVDAATRFELALKCNYDDYKRLHTSLMMPTNISIDVDLFRETMDKYSLYFKSWSNNRPDMWDIRKGLPLVNLTGNIDDNEDITIGPLDFYNKNNPSKRFNETDIVSPTPVLYEKCFEPLRVLHKYLVRSSILKWENGANFFPHFDLKPPTPHFRLWGTDNPESIKLRFKNKNDEFEEMVNVEPGRIYIIDTAEMHDAICIGETAYQFFIAVKAESYDFLNEIKV